MARNTKTGRSSDRSDRQHLWLSLLLIFTCICLITAILVISFFIYREIDRRAIKLNNITTDTAGMFKGQYKVATTRRKIFPETLTTSKPVTTLLKTTSSIGAIWRSKPIKYTVLNTSARPTHPLGGEQDGATRSTSTLKPVENTTQLKYLTPTLEPEEVEVIIHSSTSPPKKAEVVTLSETSTTYTPTEELNFITSSTTSPPRKAKVERLWDASTPDFKTTSSKPSSIPRTMQVTRLWTAPATTALEISTSPKTLTTTSAPEEIEILTTKTSSALINTQTMQAWSVSSTIAVEGTTFKTTSLPSKEVEDVTLQPVNVEEKFEITSFTAVDAVTEIPIPNSTLEDYSKQKTSTSMERTEQNSLLSPVATAKASEQTSSSSSKMLEVVIPESENVEETFGTSSITSVKGKTKTSTSNSTLENHVKQQTITSTKKIELDDSIVFREDVFLNMPEAEKIVKETHTYMPVKKTHKTKHPFLAKYRDIAVDGRKTSGGTVAFSKNTTKRLHPHKNSGYSETKVEDIVTSVSNKHQQQFGPITSTTTNVTRVVSSVSSPENSKFHFEYNKPKQDSTSKEVKTYYVETVETAPTTFIKYYENGVLVPIKVCETITCKLSASKMIALIDHNSDPCEDFYSYACGGIALNRLKNPQYESLILEKLDGMEPLDKNSEKFKTFLDSCTNFNASCELSALKHLIDDTFANAIGEKRDILTAIILKMLMLDPIKASFGLLPIFDVRMELDTNGSRIPTLTIPIVSNRDQIDRDCMEGLATKDMEEKRVQPIFKKYTTCTQEINQHMKGLYQILQELSAGFPLPDSIEKIVNLMETIPNSVSKRTWNEEILNMDQNPQYLSIKDLHENYPEINWDTLFKALFKENESKVQKVRIMFKEQINEVFLFYRKNSLSDLLQALRIIFTIDMYITIVKDYDRMNIKEYCLKKSVALMEDLAANMLIKSSSKKDLEHLEDIAKHIFSTTKVQFKASIKNSSWLSDSMQKSILSVLDKIQLVASATNPLFNEPLLNYRNEKMKINSNFIQNLVSIKTNKRTIMYNKIENNPDKQWMFDYNPLSTKAWTIPGQFEVVLPQGLLLHLTYKKRRSPQIYELYSKLGFQIARGIATYFEPSKLKKLLPDVEENEVYKNYLHVRLGDPQVAKALNKFEIMAEKEDLFLNQDSRFADDLTIRLSIDTYNRTDASTDLQFLWLNYTIPQLFYLTMAQDFCKPESTAAELAVSLYEDVTLPNFFRVNSLLMNSIGFSDAYHCPLGSAMNPTFKADAFPYITYTEIDYL